MLAFLALLVVGLAVLLATRDDESGEGDGGPAAATRPNTTAAAPTTAPPATTTPPATTEPPSTTVPTTAAPVGAPGELAGAATTYVQTLDAGDFETAWALTSPAFQAAQDRSSWERYWSIYDSITLAGDPQVDEGSGTVVLPLSYDGSVESYTLTLVQGDDGTWLVDGPVGQ